MFNLNNNDFHWTVCLCYKFVVFNNDIMIVKKDKYLIEDSSNDFDILIIY